MNTGEHGLFGVYWKNKPSRAVTLRLFPSVFVCVHLWLFLFALSASAQSLILDEAMKAQNWNGTNGARVGRTAFVSGDGHSAIGQLMELPLEGRGTPSLTLQLNHTNWSGFTFLRVRTFTDQPFEMPLRVTLYNGNEGLDCLPTPVGAPGWNEFQLYLRYPGRIDLTRVRALSIKDGPREVPLPAAQRGRFYLTEMKLVGTNDATALPPPSPLPPSANPPQLRVDLDRYFPAHLPVEKFRIASGKDFVEIPLQLDDETLFNPAVRSNFIAGIETQAAMLRTQTNQLGIVFFVREPRPTNSTPLRLSAFQSWLTNTYATIGDLNGRWDSNLAHVEDITWPTPKQLACYRDSITFMQSAVTRVTHDAVAAARRGAPRAYLLGYPEPDFNMCCKAEKTLFDYYTLQRNSGWSHYLFGNSGCGDSREFLVGAPDRALISTLASRINRRLWAVPFLSEWHLPEGCLKDRATRWRDPVASRNLWLLLAAGMDGMIVQEPVPQLDAALRQVRPLWKVFGGSRPVSRLGIIRSSSSRVMNNEVEEEHNRLFTNEEDRLFANFWGHGWQPAVIYEETFRDYPKALDDYNVLALGGATHLPNWLQDALLAWVENGGTLLCSGPPGLFDPWGRRLARLMWETLGIDEARLERRAASWRWRMDVSRLKSGCVIMASDDAGEPLAVRAQHGRGEIVVSLAPFGEVKPLRDYWPWKLHDRVKREIESPERNLYLDWRPTENPRTFFSVAINLSPYIPLKTFVIANGQFGRVLNLSADGGASPLPRETTEYSTSFPLELPPGGGAVLMLEKASARRR